ncbi:hypothetical protein BGZ70_002864, partial [Mortierella alpina]
MICQHCLPPKETVNYTSAIRCPFRACSRNGVHSMDELSIDVTLTNLTSAIRAASLESGTLANILSEDTDYWKAHQQPDTLYYGSTVLDPTWSPTLEGLFDPYDEANPAGSTSSSSHHPHHHPLVKEDPSPMALYRNITAVLDAVRPKIQQEIECQVCFLVFEEPFTTECGHTFCKSCLITSLDHKPTCPLCRRKLPLYMHYHNQRPNKTLVRFLQYLAKHLPPNDSKDKDSQESNNYCNNNGININNNNNNNSKDFFSAKEYRKMLRNVLKTESKMFGMVLPPRRRKDHDVDRIAWEPSMAYGTLLQVLSCELLPDGRALVETVGLSRFQVLTYSMMDGYYTATAVELVHDIPLEHEVGLEKAMLEAVAQKQKEAERAENEGEDAADEDDTGLREEVEGFRAQSGKYRQEQEQEQEQEQAQERQQGRTQGQELGSEETAEVGVRSLMGSLSLSSSSSEAAAIVTATATAESAAATALVTASSSSSSSTLERSPSGASNASPESSGPSSLRAPGTGLVELKDLQQLDPDRLSRKQLMQILLSFVAHMQERLGPQDTQRLQREFGEMVEDEGQFFSFWVASILPVRSDQ